MSTSKLLAKICALIITIYCGEQIDARGSIYDDPWTCALPLRSSTQQPFYANVTVCVSTVKCTQYLISNRNDAKLAAAGLIALGFVTSGRQIVYIVHGIAKNFAYATWVPCMGEAILTRETSTVIGVDWKIGSDISNGYRTVAANTVLASDAIYYLTDEIKNNVIIQLGGMPYTYCVGHSVGAHVCGQASRKYGKFDRLTGLDPAGPGYDMCPSFSQLVLRPTDAQCVDTIHTEAGGSSCPFDPAPWWGSMVPFGLVNFFPNSGLAPQPHCSVSHTSHQKAVDYYTQSVKGDPFPTNGPCADQWSLPASCANGNQQQQQQMGYASSCYKGSTAVPGVFYGTADVPALACYIYFEAPFDESFGNCNF